MRARYQYNIHYAKRNQSVKTVERAALALNAINHFNYMSFQQAIPREVCYF